MTTPKRGRGRPPKAPEARRKDRVHFNTTEEEACRIREEAAERGMEIGPYIRFKLLGYDQ